MVRTHIFLTFYFTLIFLQPRSYWKIKMGTPKMDVSIEILLLHSQEIEYA